MLSLVDLALEIQRVLEDRGYKFYFIGGLAVQFWGQNRLTDDVDLNLITNFQNEDNIIDDLFSLFTARHSDALEMAKFARVVLVKNKDGVPIDIALGGLPFEIEAYENSVLIDIPNKGKLRVISPEDLIIMKAFAARPHDWKDVESIVKAQGLHKLNTSRILDTVTMLANLKEEPEIVNQLSAIFDRYQ